MTSNVELPVRGPFVLAESIRFLERFSPARLERAGDGVLRLATWVEGSDRAVAVAIRQLDDGRVVAVVDPPVPEAAGQLARLLSLDVDATEYPAVVAADPVVAPIAAARPGFRPTGFWSPYEAACWAVLSQRSRIPVAAALKDRIAQTFGTRHELDGVELTAFPVPQRLVEVVDQLPVPDVKRARLRGLAEAALDGRLTGERLRAVPAEAALAAAQELPGIGAFSAELVVVRGAGAPDVFPSERRLHARMAELYGLGAPSPDELARLAQRWVPYRSWIAVLLRSSGEEARHYG